MISPDVNVLLHAHRADAPQHAVAHAWLQRATAGERTLALSELVCSAFLRITTNPRVFRLATPLPAALAFIDALRAGPRYVPLAPGPRHWDVFVRLCRDVDARGNLVADAYLAAMAIESGAEWVTFDRDFSRFSALRWSTPE